MSTGKTRNDTRYSTIERSCVCGHRCNCLWGKLFIVSAMTKVENGPLFANEAQSRVNTLCFSMYRLIEEHVIFVHGGAISSVKSSKQVDNTSFANKHFPSLDSGGT